jgi:hypothetical protein
MAPKALASDEHAEVIALKALAFLAREQTRLERFASLTGLDSAGLRQMALTPEGLAGVLDHLLADESLLLVFCSEEDLRPQQVVAARHRLPGASRD